MFNKNLKVLGDIGGVSFVVFQKHPSKVHLATTNIAGDLSDYQRLTGIMF